MAPEGVQDSLVFISTLPANRGHERLARGVLLASALAFLVIAPFAQISLPAIWAFIPAYEAASAVNDLMTAVLLFGQAAILKSTALLLLASGYLLAALMAVPHALSFPGLFSPTGLLGAGPQTTAWLYMFWHAGFLLFVIGYATLGIRYRRPRSMRAAIGGSVVAVLASVCGLTLVATVGQQFLPPIMRANQYAPAMGPLVAAVVLLNVVAIAVVWRQRSRSTLDLWLGVVLCAWLLDILLSAGLNAGRFDLGFYAGRLFGIMAASFVLIVLLLENSMLYARLVKAHERERERSTELLTANRDLDAANKELDAFSYSVSHDLRAPLRGVDGCATILVEDHSERLGAEGRRLIQAIRTDCQRMRRLIDDLLAFSRLGRQPLSTRPVPLNELVAQILLELRPGHQGRSIHFEVGELGTAEADPALLKEALVNLLGNAIKFTGQTESPHIELGSMSDPAFEGRVYFVKDNGAGFDMRHANKLFGVFERLHRQDEFEGTGVGLAIVQRIIERHGGRVWADAKPGEGAAFYFTLQAGLP
ncbi:MAG TPA: MASE4 domain-containing protein [Burkholderiaceae bacterium]|nr:MASE4 domain-containing protein [Burkholderiaceae bacterium]